MKTNKQKTRVERGLYWGRALKLVEGCEKVSPGCLNCWAEREAAMRIHNPNQKISNRYQGLIDCNSKWNGKISLREDNLELPSKIKKPTRFCIWNDLFHENVPVDFIFKAFVAMLESKQHVFLVLTKRPERMKSFIDELYFSFVDAADQQAKEKNRIDYLNVPTWFRYSNDNMKYISQTILKNIWLGVTAENQKMADERIPILLDIPAAVRFVSIEPILGLVNIEKYLTGPNAIRWVIVGEESGHNARKINPILIRDLRAQCASAGVPFFLKQMWIDGKLVKMPKLDGRIHNHFP